MKECPFPWVTLCSSLQQAAEAIAESVLSVARAEAIVAVTGESGQTQTGLPAGELSVVVHALRDGTEPGDLATIVESLALGETPRSSVLASASDSVRNNQNNAISAEQAASSSASSAGASSAPLVRISGLCAVSGEGGEVERRPAATGSKKQLPAGKPKEVGPMSVSVPNLTTGGSGGQEPSTAASTAFAAMARRRTLAGSHAAAAAAAAAASAAAATAGSACASAASPSASPAPSPASFFPRGPTSVSSLVRLALSSNFPGQHHPLPRRSIVCSHHGDCGNHFLVPPQPC